MCSQLATHTMTIADRSYAIFIWERELVWMYIWIFITSPFEQCHCYYYCYYYYHYIVIGLFTFILSCVGMCPKTYLTIYVYGQHYNKAHLCVDIVTYELPLTPFTRKLPSSPMTQNHHAEQGFVINWMRMGVQDSDGGENELGNKKNWWVIYLMRYYECR